MKRTAAIACALALALSLSACSPSGESSAQPGSVPSGAAPPPPSPEEVPSGSSASGADSQPEPVPDAVLYIGMDGQFAQYPLEGEATPEALVAGIGELTGWNLDLAGEITTGKGGMTVTFAETSALFVGPPDPQKEEFHVFDAGQLNQTILDSIQKTLQEWAVVPGLGDPDSVDIYFCGPDGGDLVLDNLGLTISGTEPYRGFPN